MFKLLFDNEQDIRDENIYLQSRKVILIKIPDFCRRKWLKNERL